MSQFYVPAILTVCNSLKTGIISLNRINQLIYVMVKCGVLFEVRTEFLNIIYRSFVFKKLIL
jgi:hypothetical protein